MSLDPIKEVLKCLVMGRRPVPGGILDATTTAPSHAMQTGSFATFARAVESPPPTLARVLGAGVVAPVLRELRHAYEFQPTVVYQAGGWLIVILQSLVVTTESALEQETPALAFIAAAPAPVPVGKPAVVVCAHETATCAQLPLWATAPAAVEPLSIFFAWVDSRAHRAITDEKATHQVSLASLLGGAL